MAKGGGVEDRVDQLNYRIERIEKKLAQGEKTSALYADLARAAMMLSSDQPNEGLDALYLHGLSKGMVESIDLFEFVWAYCRLSGTNLVGDYRFAITFNGSDGEGMGDQNKPGAAWPGKQWYIEELSRESTLARNLLPTGPGLHTRDEADKFVALAKKTGWKSVVVFSVAYHAVRSMSCFVAAMDAAGYYFKVYFVAPPKTNWWLPMMGSQGLEETNSFRESEVEAKKVVEKYWQGGEGAPEYWKKSWGVPPKYLFHYLQHRDQIVGEQKFPLFSLD